MPYYVAQSREQWSVCMCVNMCFSVCECLKERASRPYDSCWIPSFLHDCMRPCGVDKHTRRTPTALNSALGDNLQTFLQLARNGTWYLSYDSLEKIVAKESSLIQCIKMMNFVTKKATIGHNLSPLNTLIDHTFTTWFVSICCEHKLNQIMHWSWAWGEICHSFAD